MISILILVIHEILTVSVGYLFHGLYLEKKRGWSSSKVVGLLLAAGILWSLLSELVESAFPLNTIAFALGSIFKAALCFFIVTLPYAGKLSKRCFLTLFLITLSTMAEAISMTLFLWWKQLDSILSVKPVEAYAVNWTLLLLMYGLVVIIKRVRKNKGFITKPLSLYALESLVPLLSLLLLFLGFKYLERTGLLVIALIIVVMDVAAFFFFERIEQYYAQNQSYALQEQQNQMREDYYQQVEAHQKEIRIMKHDMQNQLIALDGLLRTGNLEKAEKNVQQLVARLAADTQYDFTAHPAINALLGAKYKQARENNILCDFDVKMPEDVQMNGSDLVAAVGNILDNAIEACQHCTNKRYIRLRVMYYNASLIVNCENSTDGKHVDLQTRKKDPANHGLGLESVRSIVNSYRGDLQSQYIDQHFQIEFTLFE
ncbi:sensor histidine kinase [Enterococcus hulanensis]|uniref:sensor histidine kinase n=1 Tax=Enterococcus hulanensis TaxID=2559929 RepID=UPI001A8D2140|nr:GHKL domain-containing protein [Enterococcus hulanensis]MBO0458837.1 sensor histidine kinase [Enterococcus hulanensis]